MNRPTIGSIVQDESASNKSKLTLQLNSEAEYSDKTTTTTATTVTKTFSAEENLIIVENISNKNNDLPYCDDLFKDQILDNPKNLREEPSEFSIETELSVQKSDVDDLANKTNIGYLKTIRRLMTH